MRPLFVLGVLVASIGSTARADILCHAVNTPLVNTNWSTTVQVPRFDPSLGTLNLVDVCVSGQIFGGYGVESLESIPNPVTIQFSAVVPLARPDLSIIAIAVPTVNGQHNLSAFDGTIDFGGTSGVFQSGLSALATTQVNLTSAMDLALFSGSPGNPGLIVLPISGQGASTATGFGHLITQFQTQAAGLISICYDYTPFPISFCAGDGMQTACPCANNSSVGANQGCLNSFGFGAALRGAGVASIASDSLVLTCSNLPAMTSCLFFQGTAQTNGGAGTNLGDGLRCVSGTLVRLATKAASGGSVSYPLAGDPPISVRGSVPGNTTRYYQAWYRNPAAFCTSATFNLSQGVAVQWAP